MEMTERTLWQCLKLISTDLNKKARVAMGEEPAHFLNMMDRNFITLQVGIVVTRIIVAIVTSIVVIIAAIIKILFSKWFLKPCFQGGVERKKPTVQDKDGIMLFKCWKSFIISCNAMHSCVHVYNICMYACTCITFCQDHNYHYSQVSTHHVFARRVQSQCNSVGSKKPLVRTSQVDDRVIIIAIKDP